MDIVDRMVVLKDGTILNIYTREKTIKNVQIENGLRAFYEEDLVSEQPKIEEDPNLYFNGVKIENKGYQLDERHTFNLSQGECMALIGSNGIGKTTLCKRVDRTTRY